MTAAREEILAGVRRALGRGALPPEAAAELASRVAAHRRNLIPERAAALDAAGLLALFIAMAEEAGASVRRVERLEDVAAAVADYLAGENLPAEIVMAPDRALDEIPWGERPLVALRRGRADAQDAVSLTPAFAAIAETGTLMLISGEGTPTSLNFLPDTHIVVLRRDQLVASYEDGFDRLRAAAEKRGWPRTVNFITGPSRTADIELQIQLGAHGPRRLHVVLIDGKNPAESE